MSLVGSLEDLGLGDILQIVSLSRKSGLLLLRSDAGEGRIVLCDGLVRGAFVKGEPEDLRGLLVGGGFVDEEQFEDCARAAAESGRPLSELVCGRTGQTGERIDSLRREHVERAVLQMFTWCSGEFSFEVREAVSERDSDLLLPTGINAQYLTMEATRLGDEDGAAQGQASFSDEEPLFSGEGEDGADEPAPIETPSDDLATVIEPDPGEAHQALALAAARSVEEEPRGIGEIDELDESTPVSLVPESVAVPDPAAEPEPPPASAVRPVALVAIEPDLAALEWLKASLSELFERIHIFQDSEHGIARIRQYLARAQRPVVLLGTRVRGDGIAGPNDVASLVRRLKQLAPSMPVLVLRSEPEADEPQVPGADACVARPPTWEVAERKRWSRLESDAEDLRAQLAGWSEQCAVSPALVSPIDPEPQVSQLARLKRVSARLRDPSGRGDVLARVLEFASECFSRVAIFMVRDDTAQGIAQLGLDRAGGPDDEALQQIELSALETDGFRRVIENREAIRFTPSTGRGRLLADLLGTETPAEAYIAPIESGGHVAALLYADNLPGQADLGDTTALEIALHEAGLALDRALLERALAEALGRSEPEDT